jgi:thioredoxin-like negative regulator of GroEL
LLILIALVHHSTPLYEDDTHITQLTAENFEETLVDSYYMWIVKFYSSRCRYSISAAPEFSKIASELNDRYQFGAVDCLYEKEVCFRWYEIYSFPTIGFLYENMIINYNGEINLANITEAAGHAFNAYDEHFNEEE